MTTKAGRTLSGVSRQRITAAIEALRELLEQADLRELPEDTGALSEDKSVVLEPPQSSLAAIKALGGDRIGGYAVLWGDARRRDVVGEFFTPETDDLEGPWRQRSITPKPGGAGAEVVTQRRFRRTMATEVWPREGEPSRLVELSDHQ
jgi:hypothetical protein